MSEAARFIPEAKKGKPTAANDRQVGGDHYQTGGIQHWDMFGPESMIYAATKYVARWRKKNGVQDLEKALHYAEKLLEIINRAGATESPWLPVDQNMVDTWAPNQGITWVETVIIKRLMFYEKANDVREAIEGIRHLISEAPRLTPPKLVEGATVHVVDDLSPAMAERRVPRYANTSAMPDTPSCGDGLFDTHQQRRAERVADGGAQHASLRPWQIDRDEYMRLSSERRSLLDAFYVQRASHMMLEPFVEKTQALPRELQACYSWATNTGSEPGYWLIMIDRVPADLRDFYPRLTLELNMKELDEAPRWQRGLYAREGSEEDGKFRLLDRALAWGPEL